jgi:hypothetical protein
MSTAKSNGMRKAKTANGAAKLSDHKSGSLKDWTFIQKIKAS